MNLRPFFKLILSLSLILILISMGSLAVFAQRPPVDPPPFPPPIEPPFPPRPPLIDQDVYLRTHRVNVSIDEQVATTRIEQVFFNPSDFIAEGTYIFPLPPGATVSDLVMFVDGQPITGRILNANEARDIYEEIVRTLRDPALLQYIGQDAIQASVFPIPPRDEVKLEITYSHILTLENGLLRYSYPLRTEQFTRQPVTDLAINLEVNSSAEIGSVYSPSHPIAIDRISDNRFRAGYERSNSRENSDFTLYYSLADETIDLSLLTYRENSREDGFFLLLLTPPFQVDADQIQARDVIIVLDQSGSMFGTKWEQAQGAARYILDNLNAEDRFNIVAFSTGWRNYANALQWANGDEVRSAKRWIDGLEAVGGTNIDGALGEAFNMTDRERQTVVLFLTDGLPTEGETNTSRIIENAQANAPSNIRLFSFGVGDDVDTFLLDNLSREFRGATAYVRPNERIDEEVSALYNKIALPVMTDIELSFGGLTVDDLYPSAPLPDLFVGSQLIVAGRYREGGRTDITLSGIVNGERQTVVYRDVQFPTQTGGEPNIPRLWATRKIGAMMNSIRLQGENPELVDSIVRLSLRYGIITPYTSFLIEEDDIFTQSGRESAANRADGFGLSGRAPSGSAAVDAADMAFELEAAEMAAPAPSLSMPADSGGGGRDGNFDADESNAPSQQTALQTIGDRTFIWRDGVWVDTAYDADEMTLIEIAFLSDAYFDLLDAHPEIGAYLALGERLILVIEGEAYSISAE